MASGDVIRYRDAEGELLTHVLGSRPGELVVPVKVLDVRSPAQTADTFDLELPVYLREAGQYRLTDKSGAELVGWKNYPNEATPIFSAKLPRSADNEYVVSVIFQGK